MTKRSDAATYERRKNGQMSIEEYTYFSNDNVQRVSNMISARINGGDLGEVPFKYEIMQRMRREWNAAHASDVMNIDVLNERVVQYFVSRARDGAVLKRIHESRRTPTSMLSAHGSLGWMYKSYDETSPGVYAAFYESIDRHVSKPLQREPVRGPSGIIGDGGPGLSEELIRRSFPNNSYPPNFGVSGGSGALMNPRYRHNYM